VQTAKQIEYIYFEWIWVKIINPEAVWFDTKKHQSFVDPLLAPFWIHTQIPEASFHLTLQVLLEARADPTFVDSQGLVAARFLEKNAPRYPR
jgi:hypothetical protein